MHERKRRVTAARDQADHFRAQAQRARFGVTRAFWLGLARDADRVAGERLIREYAGP